MNIKEAHKKLEKKLNAGTSRLYLLIDGAPTTNIRILTTIGLAIGTAIKYWASEGGANGWVPNWEWLLFLAGMAGLDVWQHHNKRKTEWSPEQIARADVIKNGHDMPTATAPAELPNESEMG